ncbi:MAG: type II toxin-antitoxin system VapC family toxin [Magnetococcales bacterium]|nr:type II toxin-antitoxin system VapC family toxin [Magnetococcales bacterium]
MTGSCLIDTNVLIDFLSQSPDEAFNERVLAALSDQSAVSIVTTIELLGWRRHTAQSRSSAANLLACLQELPLTRREAEVAIGLRSQSPIRLGDAIIAATALTTGLPLMTRNTEDFRRIDGLRLIDPFGNT